jgi:hypothetical protein
MFRYDSQGIIFNQRGGGKAGERWSIVHAGREVEYRVDRSCSYRRKEIESQRQQEREREILGLTLGGGQQSQPSAGPVGATKNYRYTHCKKRLAICPGCH